MPMRIYNLFFYFTENEPRKDRDLAGVGPGSYNASLADKKQEPRYG